MTVLIVDDDAAIREILRAYLLREGYRVFEALDGVAALRLTPKADLLVLDIMLPDLSGWDVAQRVKRDRPELPILMLSALGAEDERVYGLELGADDYVVKPFSPREVVARVRSLSRRLGAPSELRCGDLTIRADLRKVFVGGKEVHLSKLEYELLLTLAQHPDMVWSRERLLERVWGEDFLGMERTVDTRVAGLRKKLEDEGEVRYIETVRGVGYRFRGQ